MLKERLVRIQQFNEPVISFVAFVSTNEQLCVSIFVHSVSQRSRFTSERSSSGAAVFD
jgi:hypothetical protein